MIKCACSTCTRAADYVIPVYCGGCPEKNRTKNLAYCKEHLGAVIKGTHTCSFCGNRCIVAGPYSPLPDASIAKPEIRVGDKEKGEVMDLLAESFSGGYMTQEEFYERQDAIYRARTRNELAELVNDLPAAAPPYSPNKDLLPAKDGLHVNLTYAAGFVVGLLLIALIIGMGIL